MKDINIVFVNFRCKDDVLQAIASLKNDIVDCPYAVQITVVDNSGNADGIREAIVAQHSAAVYVDPKKNIGFGRGNVMGFQSGVARYYFSLNRDTVIPERSKTIERIIRYMDAHPKIGCIGPKLLNMDGSLQHSCCRFDLPSILIKPLKQIDYDKRYRWAQKYTNRLLMTDFDHAKTRPVDWVLGAAMIVRREVVDDIGWFHDRYFMYLEDADWCRRMWDAGWPVYYVHDIVIFHRHERGSAQVPGIVRALFENKLARIHFVSWAKFLWKWKGTFRYYRHVSR